MGNEWCWLKKRSDGLFSLLCSIWFRKIRPLVELLIAQGGLCTLNLMNSREHSPHLVKNFPAFYRIRRFIICSQKRAPFPYPEPHESRPRLPPILLIQASFQFYPSICAWVFRMDSLLRVSKLKLCIHFLVPLTRRITRLFLLPWLCSAINIYEDYKLWSSSLSSFLQPLITLPHSKYNPHHLILE
jgi:hypothetical protein